MATIDFPITISQLIEMRKDRDRVSLFLSYATLMTIELCLVFLSLYYFSSSKAFEAMGVVCIPLAAAFLLVIYFYRPYFLLSEPRKFKQIDKLKGLENEAAIEKLTPEEQERFLGKE
jgi:hypothetical protein